MTAPAWMPLYIAEYLADTGHLSAAEHGAYLLLIMHYWQHEGLPAEEPKLARIARMTSREWASSRDTIAAFFTPEWRHGRIDDELATAAKTMSKRSAAGKAGASARYSNRMANAKQTDAPIPVPSPRDRSSSVGEEAAREPAGERFEGELRAALGDRAPPEEADFAPIAELLEAGFDFVKDILPACRAAAGKATEGVGSWRFYAVAVGRKPKANGTPGAPMEWLPADSPRWGEMNKRSMTEKHRPLLAMGSMEAAGVGAFVPKAWLEERSAA